ncbi:MAG: iron hydrogenase, partial [Oscillospiraceae bacterium]|nr:iron hydrogenase [Oscillospiraceae bacterium]
MMAPMVPGNPSVLRYFSQCFHCGNCKWTCLDQAGVLGMYNLDKAGGNAVCIYCGQCVNECPGYAMSEVPEYPEVIKAIKDSGKIVIASTSPAVRASISEEFGLGASFSQGKLVALLKKLGFDYVLDTNFGADLTITEEATELVSRIKNGGVLPMFTSCCPSWVRYAEIFYPEIIPNISSVKSPILMQGPIIKTWFAKNRGIDPSSIVNVAVAPCTSKKYEIRLPDRNAAGVELGIDMRDMDNVITTRELAKWAHEAKIDFASLEDMEFDSLSGSGAGAIFGATGGVMEAALRTAYYYINGVNPPEKFYELTPVRGLSDVREA